MTSTPHVDVEELKR
jgi:hypothetical protein